MGRKSEPVQRKDSKAKAVAKAEPNKRLAKKTAGEPSVKTEPTSPAKEKQTEDRAEKETLGLARNEVSGLLTSLRYQCKAKKVTDSHRAQAARILQDYENGDIASKRGILLRLQKGGMKDLSWTNETTSSHTSETAQSEKVRKGFFNRIVFFV